MVALQVGVACHTLHVTHHASDVARHASHVTRHTSHVTRHTSFLCFQENLAQGQQQDAGETRLSLSTLEVVIV